jgi:hypothetical protein
MIRQIVHMNPITTATARKQVQKAAVLHRFFLQGYDMSHDVDPDVSPSQ